MLLQRFAIFRKQPSLWLEQRLKMAQQLSGMAYARFPDGQGRGPGDVVKLSFQKAIGDGQSKTEGSRDGEQKQNKCPELSHKLI